MPTQRDRHDSQSPLRMCLSHYTCACDRPKTSLIMVRDVKVVKSRGSALKALGTVPSHILDCEECTIIDQDEVKEAMTDDSAVRSLDDGRKDREGRGW